MRDKVQWLLARAAEISREPASTRRRDELISEVVAAGHPREYADLIYDVAEETGLDPALGFALVLSGIGVRDLASAPPDQWQETRVAAPPAWIDPNTPRPDEADRERHLRRAFRRLQSLIEAHPAATDAVQVFVRGADVGDVAY